MLSYTMRALLTWKLRAISPPDARGDSSGRSRAIWVGSGAIAPTGPVPGDADHPPCDRVGHLPAVIRPGDGHQVPGDRGNGTVVWLLHGDRGPVDHRVAHALAAWGTGEG